MENWMAVAVSKRVRETLGGRQLLSGAAREGKQLFPDPEHSPRSWTIQCKGRIQTTTVSVKGALLIEGN